MKKIIGIISLALILVAGTTGWNEPKSGIHGIVDPPEGARKIWAVNGRDSFFTIPVSGNFALEVPPGTWKLVVETVKPYRTTEVSNIFVQENQSTDAGVINLLPE